MTLRLFVVFALAAALAPSLLPTGAESSQRRRARQAASAARGAGKAAAPKPTPKPSPAPVPAAGAKPKIEVRQIDEAGLGKLLKDEAERGRPLLVNFWATWCTPCREEFPDLVRIDEEFRSTDAFEFVTVSLDDPSDIATAVPGFLSEMRAGSIPAYLLNAADPEAAIALVDKSWRGELPATYLFGRKGEILFKHTGRVKPDELRKAIAAATGGG